MSKREYWNARYAAKELVWGAEPNQFVAAAYGDVEPTGRALDLACGEGRNAIWLAERGWETTGLDYSRVAIERARAIARERKTTVRFLEADVTTWIPDDVYALVLISYLQLPEPEFRQALGTAAAAVGEGGELFAIGHARRNLVEGFGGPEDPRVLWDPEAISAELERLGLTVDSAEHVTRKVADAPRPAIDVRVRGHREAR